MFQGTDLNLLSVEELLNLGLMSDAIARLQGRIAQREQAIENFKSALITKSAGTVFNAIYERHRTVEDALARAIVERDRDEQLLAKLLQ